MATEEELDEFVEPEVLEPDLDGNVEIDISEPDPLDEDPDYDDDTPNLVPVFLVTEEGKKALKKVATQVKEDFDRDYESSEKYRKRVQRDLALFAGDLKPRHYPWKDAPNAHVPSMMENMSRIHARVESEVVGNYQNFVNVVPTGPDDQATARALTMHVNWQLREKIPDFRRQISRGIMMFFVVGDVTCHSYWDPETRSNRHEMLGPEEFVVPFAYTTTMPDYGDLPHYTKRLWRYRHQLEKMKDAWHDVDRVLDKQNPSWDEEPGTEIRDERGDAEGIEKPDDGEAPYQLLWYEGWLTLPGQKMQRWCLVILDYSTSAILSLSIHEEVNWEEKIRFERQQSELDLFRQVETAHAEAEMGLAQSESDLAILNDMDPVKQQATMQLQAARQALPPPPQPPTWLASPEDPLAGPEPARKDPIRMFAHGVCMEPMSGNLGLGLGRIQADLNRAQDTALCQFTDSAHLANVGAFLTTEGFELPKDQEISPGAFIKVQGVMVGGLKDAIMPLQFPPANPQLLELIDRFQNFSSTSAQSPGVLSGESGKSGETYRGIASRIEQATKQLSVPAGHFCDFITVVVQNNARLNATYMPDEEVFYVLDHMKGQNVELRAGRKLYERSYRVSMTTDRRFAAQAQRIAEADELLSMPKAVPALQGNLAFQRYAAVKALQARGVEEAIQFIGAEPPPVKFFGESLMQQAMAEVQKQMAMKAQAMAQGRPGLPGGPSPGRPQEPPNGSQRPPALPPKPPGVPGPGGPAPGPPIG